MDDLDQPASVVVGAAPRRSTSSLDAMCALQCGTIRHLLSLVIIITVSGSACSRSTNSKADATPGIQDSLAEARRIYNPASLVEVKSLAGFPEGLQVAMGARIKGYGRIADVGEECNPTDVVGAGPDRCFLLGGVSDTSALVAYKVGGYAGQSGEAAAYVHVQSDWIRIQRWQIGYPINLHELQGMTSFSPDATIER
jgi:hypothetical protein